MKSLLAPVRSVRGPNRVDLAVECVEDEWRRNGHADVNRIWTEQKQSLRLDEGESVAFLAELIKADLRCRYERGESPSVTGYLNSYKELRDADSRVVSLIYERYCLGEERGDVIDVESFCARYPQWQDSLRSQLQCHHMFSQATGRRSEPPPFPNPGDTFEEFKLVSLLGEGGISRVFLARDLSLGGKKVVLKVSLDRGQEPKAQGALDHPHIVPVNSVVFNDRDMRGLSMPFRPGLPLDAIIKRIKPDQRPRKAKAIWNALVDGTPVIKDSPLEISSIEGQKTPDREPRPKANGWVGFPMRGTYAQGVAWIIMTLAEALDYAHRRQTYHRDVKPGNVLLTLEHGPQLLDFNLAKSPHTTTQAEAAMQGGTLPYMAPEQIEAFLFPSRWEKVDARADIYSLGLVLRELLTGQQPELPAQTISPQRAMQLLLDRRPLIDVAVSRINPSIPRALEAILAKCLTVAPENRYPDAGTLADDLRRFLNHQSLTFAVNPSRRERVGNWAIRNRLSIGTVATVILIMALLFMPVRRQMQRHFVPIETLPRYQAAIQAIDDRKFPDNREFVDEQIIKPLQELLPIYPESWDLKLYLSLAHNGINIFDPEVESYFREVMRTPDSAEKMRVWGTKHPSIARHLDKFAENRLEQLETILENRPGAKPQEIEQLEREHISLAKYALELATSIDPKSIPILSHLARAEGLLGEYERAHQRIMRVKELILSEADDSKGDATRPSLESRLIEPGSIQCGIDRRWAKNLRDNGDFVGSEKLLKEAGRVARYLVDFVQIHDPDNAANQRDSLQILIQVILGLGETQVGLGNLTEARNNRDFIRQKLSVYRTSLHSTKKKMPQEIQESLDRLDERLKPKEGQEGAVNLPSEEISGA